MSVVAIPDSRDRVLRALKLAPQSVKELRVSLSMGDTMVRRILDELRACKQVRCDYIDPVTPGRPTGIFSLANAPRPHSEKFQSRSDGEYALCVRCLSRGYGYDSWHPATDEFWPHIGGTLVLSFQKCLACKTELACKASGVVPETMVAA